MGTCCADHVTPLYPQKLALTSPTGGGRSVGIVRSRTKATELLVSLVVYVFLDAATLTEVFPCFFLSCKANARVNLAKTGHGPQIVVLFYVLFVLCRSMYCLCVNVYCTTATG